MNIELMRIFFGLFGILLLGHATWVFYRIRRGAHWPSANGRMISSERVTFTDDGADSYRAELKYSYVVGARTYVGTDLNFFDRTILQNFSSTDAVLARYPVGKIVAVYYDPNTPERSVLERTGTRIWIGVLSCVLFGVIFVIFCRQPSIFMLDE